MQRFEEIPHTADWSFRAFGSDLRELFENAAFAMFALEDTIPADAETRPAGVTRTVETAGVDYESLLVNWLNELLYLQDLHHETFYRFHVERLAQDRLQATVFGQVNPNIEKLIKAATYHNLKIDQSPSGWQAVVVVDV